MKLISFEGCTGTGKSTFARQLADELGAAALLEKYEDVPTLGIAVTDPETFAFSTAVEFTSAHAGYLKAAASHPLVVTDFTMARDLLFAGLRLKSAPNSLARYHSFWKKTTATLPIPDYVILLEASPEVLLDRITLRGRPFESGLTSQVLLHMSHVFRQLYGSSPGWQHARFVETLDTTNLSRIDETVRALASRVKATLGIAQGE